MPPGALAFCINSLLSLWGCAAPREQAPLLLEAEGPPLMPRRPSLCQMSWSPNSWATRPRSAPLSPWSHGAGSSTAPLGFGSRSLLPGWTTRGTAGRGTPPACVCSAVSLVRGAPSPLFHLPDSSSSLWRRSQETGKGEASHQLALASLGDVLPPWSSPVTPRGGVAWRRRV